MKQTIFTGTATALITPFSADGKEVDYASFEHLVNFQVDNCADALVVAGTTGEAPVLTATEKSELIKLAKINCGHIPVIAGTGSNNTEEAVIKSNEAEKQGVDGLLIVTPYYNKCTQQGLIDHYFYIADRVSTPIIIYNVPSRTGVDILPETYCALSEHKNIVAVKDATGNISSFNRSVICGKDLAFYAGNDDLLVEMMCYGAKGVISVVSNIIPAIIKRITEACINNQFANAVQLHKTYLNLMNSMFCEVNPIPIKAACSTLFGYNNTVRLPLNKISPGNEAKLREILSESGLLAGT